MSRTKLHAAFKSAMYESTNAVIPRYTHSLRISVATYIKQLCDFNAMYFMGGEL